MTLEYWNERALFHYGVGLDVMNGSNNRYVSLREKYAELENVISDTTILSDLAGITRHYPALGNLAMLNGTRFLIHATDQSPKVSDRAQALIRASGLNVRDAFVRAMQEPGDHPVAVEIVRRFHMEEEYAVINASIETALKQGDESYVRDILNIDYPISYSTVVRSLQAPCDDSKKELLMSFLQCH